MQYHSVAFVERLQLLAACTPVESGVEHQPVFTALTLIRNQLLQIVTLINQYKPVAFFNGHDHIMTLANPGNFTNGFTSYVTTGAGSQHGYADFCGPNKVYSNGGDGGFVIVEATPTTFTVRGGRFLPTFSTYRLIPVVAFLRPFLVTG